MIFYLIGSVFFGVVCNLLGVRGMPVVGEVIVWLLVGVVVYFFGADIRLGDRRFFANSISGVSLEM